MAEQAAYRFIIVDDHPLFRGALSQALGVAFSNSQILEAGSLDELPGNGRRALGLVRFRCVGQIQAGMLLQLIARGAPRVLVAGCRADRCRFCDGPMIADEQARLARDVLGKIGEDPDRIQADWSENRARDRLDAAVERFRSRRLRRRNPRGVTR